MTKIIVLDAGHGGSDSGAVGHGLQEKNVTLAIAKKTRDFLNNNYEGHAVKMTRDTDKTVSLSDRSNFANKLNADCFVSIHINAHTSDTADGFETFIYNGGVGNETKAFQNVLHRQIQALAKFPEDRGQKQANFHVLRETNMNAVLTENGFISNKSDASLLSKDSFLDSLGRGHAEGIAEFLGLKRKQSQPPATESPNNGGTLYRVQVGAFNSRSNAERMVKELQSKGYKDAFISE